MPSVTTDLWEGADTGAGVDHAVLHGRQCISCGLRLFPPQEYGCPGCGALADQLLAVELPAIGRLHSFAVVNLHPVLPTPYTIVEVELDSGPLIRALFDPEEAPAIGERVIGQGATYGRGTELVFARAEKGPQ
ncbi:MAG: hypothetical protein DYG91_13020 [Chloroflexi bacterium CFX7]|nr:hypothetical protein [Chloroflexi bacterium CFX7]